MSAWKAMKDIAFPPSCAHPTLSQGRDAFQLRAELQFTEHYTIAWQDVQPAARFTVQENGSCLVDGALKLDGSRRLVQAGGWRLLCRHALETVRPQALLERHKFAACCSMATLSIQLIPSSPASSATAFGGQVFTIKADSRKAEGLDIGIVGMRVDARTIAADKLREFVEGLGLPVLGYLRDTQNYIHLAARGLSVFDVAPGRVQKDLEQWANICAWLDRPAP